VPGSVVPGVVVVLSGGMVDVLSLGGIVD